VKAYLEPEEIVMMETAAANLRDRLLVRLLFHLGCRISETLALAPENVDFVHGTITIQHLKTSLKLSCPNCSARLGKSHGFCPKCGLKVAEAVTREKEHRKMRTLPLDEGTLKMLEDYIRRGGPVTRNGKKLVFGINRHRAWQIIRGCADRAGLPKLVNTETGKRHDVSPHRLRDAFAVHAMRIDDSGDGLRLLQEQLGHASFNTTAKYRKVAGEELKTWYNKLWEEDGR
jgi:integrase/recombinase XerD